MNVGQPVVASAITICQPFMVKPHLIKNGGVKVVDMDPLVHRFEAEIVCCAVDIAALEPAARDQIRKPVVIVVPAILHLYEPPNLDSRRASEFAADQTRWFRQAIRSPSDPAAARR